MKDTAHSTQPRDDRLQYDPFRPVDSLRRLLSFINPKITNQHLDQRNRFHTAKIYRDVSPPVAASLSQKQITCLRARVIIMAKFVRDTLLVIHVDSGDFFALVCLLAGKSLAAHVFIGAETRALCSRLERKWTRDSAMAWKTLARSQSNSTPQICDINSIQSIH